MPRVVFSLDGPVLLDDVPEFCLLAGVEEGGKGTEFVCHFLKRVMSLLDGTYHFLLAASHLAPSAFASSF